MAGLNGTDARARSKHVHRAEIQTHHEILSEFRHGSVWFRFSAARAVR